MDPDRIPIRTTPRLSCSIEGVVESIDGFTPVKQLLAGRSPEETDRIRNFLSESAREGKILWLDEWSPLRWCMNCGVPLLDPRCSRCGAQGTKPIELKFPCNPRPVLPHDEPVFVGAGLPWPLSPSTVVNAYHRPDFRGWELIQAGRRIGDVVMMEGRGEVRFEPALEENPNDRPRARSDHPKSMQRVVEANRDHLDRIEREAVEFIRRRCRGIFTLPVATFSGGKDSAVLAHLCHRSGIRMRIIQVDTGIDPPDNRDYSERFLSQFPTLTHQWLDSGPIFWRAMEKLGPPANDFQWCRVVLKNSAPYRLDLMNQLGVVKHLTALKAFLPIRGVMIEGTRRREEEWRIELRREVPVPDAPINTRIIRPILDFTDLDVWMYFHRHSLLPNPTYERDRHQRLICLFCPDKDHNELAVQKKACPALWKRFEGALRRWQEELGYPDAWVEEHLWRHQAPVSSRMQELGLDRRIDKIASRLDRAVALQPMEKTGGRYRMSGRIDGPVDFVPLSQWFRLLGASRPAAGREEAAFDSPLGVLRLRSSGWLMAESRSQEDCRALGLLAQRLAVSFLNCIGCGLCRAILPAIRIRNNSVDIKTVKRGSLAIAREIVGNCPMNGEGIRRYLVLQQDA